MKVQATTHKHWSVPKKETTNVKDVCCVVGGKEPVSLNIRMCDLERADHGDEKLSNILLTRAAEAGDHRTIQYLLTHCTALNEKLELWDCPPRALYEAVDIILENDDAKCLNVVISCCGVFDFNIIKNAVHLNAPQCVRRIIQWMAQLSSNQTKTTGDLDAVREFAELMFETGLRALLDSAKEGHALDILEAMLTPCIIKLSNIMRSLDTPQRKTLSELLDILHRELPQKTTPTNTTTSEQINVWRHSSLTIT